MREALGLPRPRAPSDRGDRSIDGDGDGHASRPRHLEPRLLDALLDLELRRASKGRPFPMFLDERANPKSVPSRMSLLLSAFNRRFAFCGHRLRSRSSGPPALASCIIDPRDPLDSSSGSSHPSAAIGLPSIPTSTVPGYEHRHSSYPFRAESLHSSPPTLQIVPDSSPEPFQLVSSPPTLLRLPMVLKPLEYSECLSDSPWFRQNLHEHENVLEDTYKNIKNIEAQCRELIQCTKSESLCLRKQDLSRRRRDRLIEEITLLQ
uniref:BAR domain-containing protein n=1 Tax=Steinernema glaseri TaxID=37863 RepID=A0A1I7ZTU1_9BILA